MISFGGVFKQIPLFIFYPFIDAVDRPDDAEKLPKKQIPAGRKLSSFVN